MTVPLLDINDSNLQLWCADVLLQSPGYALLDGEQYIFGNPARAAARIRPRDINTRYWWQLNTEALQPVLGPARHTADLVHAHLLDIHQQAGQPEELMLAVSSSMQKDQLALLLGIIQRCPFDAVGLVNRSVALASLYGGPGKLYHLEIQLHQTVISELIESNGDVELQRVFPLPGCGLLQLQERLVEIIAAAFIRQTRFDPRRKADAEQQLYDALPDALGVLESAGEYNLVVMGYHARINRSDLLAAGEHLFNSAAGVIGTLKPGDRVIMDPVASLLPGLIEVFPQTELISNTALPQAVEQHQPHLVQRDQALHFITSLPCLVQFSAPLTNESASELPQHTPVPAAPSQEPPATATHLLTDASAVPLVASGTVVAAGWELHCSAGNWQLRGDSPETVQVNGTAYLPGQALHCGDTISTSGGT
ncbi:MAG: hypothetical protein V3R56_05145, partial [Xanthomonadales bacterium]